MLGLAVKVAVVFAVLVELTSAWHTIQVLEPERRRKLLSPPLLLIAACVMFTSVKGQILPVVLLFGLMYYWLSGSIEETDEKDERPFSSKEIKQT